MSKAKINLEAFKLVSFKYNLVDDKVSDIESVDVDQMSSSDINLQINRGETAHHEEYNKGRLSLDIRVTENNKFYDRFIDLEIEAFFEYDKQIDESDEEEFREYQDLIQVNGTAIILPYIRSYISSITAFDNVTQHLLLPTINIQEMFSSNND